MRHCDLSSSFFLSLYVYRCCYRKVCTITTSARLSFSPFLFVITNTRRCAPSDLDSCLFFSLFVCCCYYRKVCAIVTLTSLSFFPSMFVFVDTRCAPSQTWFVYLSLPLCFIVIAMKGVHHHNPNSCSSQHLNSHGSLTHHFRPWLQRLEFDFRCWSFDANNQVLELGILMHIAKLHNSEF